MSTIYHVRLLATTANNEPALITISTRASLKRYHSYTLTLGLGDEANEYEFLRVGTASEKDSVEKEIQELREKLSQVEEFKRRKAEIDEELNKVWVAGQELPAPEYHNGSSSEGDTVSF